MHGFSADQDPMNVASKRFLGHIVAQIHRAPQLPELCAGAMQSRASGGGAEAFQQIGCRSVAVVDGFGDAQEFIEFGVDQFEIDISAQNRFKFRHFWPVARQVQPLMAHIVLPRAQVESQQFADAEAQMRMSMGIDGKPVDRRAALTNDALDRRSDLSAQQG
jgi:hypothetical protein